MDLLRAMCGLGLAGMLAWPATAAETEPAGPPEAAVEWLAVILNGRKAGYSKSERLVAGNRVTTRLSSTIQLKRAGVLLTAQMFEESVETADGKPLAFTVRQQMGSMASTITGRVGPDGRLTATLASGFGRPRTVVMRWPEGALLPEGQRLLELRKGLQEGTTYRTRQFIPSSLRAVDVEVRVGPVKKVDLFGRVVPLTEVHTTMKAAAGVIEAVAYVDVEGNALKMVSPMMGTTVELIACTREVALSPNDPTDFFNLAFVASPARLTPKGLAEGLTYTLAPKAPGRPLRLPATDEQTVAEGPEGRRIVTVRPRAAPKGGTLPYAGKDPAALAALRPSRWVQSDAPEVAALAREAVGDAADPAEAARRIEAFVRRYIKAKNLSVGYASALEVVRGREGDCTEHAVLAAALCRAVGLPARVTTGFAYLPARNAFGPHAWVQVYIGGRWFSLDAALAGFDAGHIALGFGDGDPLDFFGIVNTLGNLKMLEARPAE